MRIHDLSSPQLFVLLLRRLVMDGVNLPEASDSDLAYLVRDGIEVLQPDDDDMADAAEQLDHAFTAIAEELTDLNPGMREQLHAALVPPYAGRKN